ncbi:MAG: hypothetical protein HYS18_09625 [Burkholderiales bacterium]|nr:hypothetical protein [Burkholderiales bacterium]
MTIKTYLPWPLRIVLWVVVLGLGGAVAMWTYEMGRSFAGFPSGPTKEQVAEYRAQIEKLTAERDRFQTTANSAESQINIERSSQKQLATQMRNLELENTRLKEDLAFFESLLPASTGPYGITIRRLKAEMIAPNQLRYRLLVMQGGKGEREFNGNLQLVVTVIQEGKSAMMTFPEGKPGEAEKYKIGFKHYQRLEGVLTLPEGVMMKAIQARVLERGQMRVQQSVNL